MRRRWLLRLAEWIARRYGLQLVVREEWVKAGLSAALLATEVRRYGLAVRVGDGAGRQVRWSELEATAERIGHGLLAAGSYSW